MDIAEVDRVLENLARDYARQLANARGSPMQKGIEAQRAWLEHFHK